MGRDIPQKFPGRSSRGPKTGHEFFKPTPPSAKVPFRSRLFPQPPPPRCGATSAPPVRGPRQKFSPLVFASVYRTHRRGKLNPESFAVSFPTKSVHPFSLFPVFFPALRDVADSRIPHSRLSISVTLTPRQYLAEYPFPPSGFWYVCRPSHIEPESFDPHLPQTRALIARRCLFLLHRGNPHPLL